MADRIQLLRDVSEADRFVRERALQTNCGLYRWKHLAGLPAFCDGLPEPEIETTFDVARTAYDVTTSVASAAIKTVAWTLHNTRKNKLTHWDRFSLARSRPKVASRWRDDEEFAQQRLNGVNPLLIERCERVPSKFAVTDERVRPVIGDHTLESLGATGRLYLCDWKALEGVPVNLGRFLTAPMALFWVDDRGVLMPVAIQLGQAIEAAKMVFTPADDKWVWLTARTHVQSADAAYHEVLTHLFRTHLAMETVKVALCRALPPQHPVHELLDPFFAGTISINYKARNDLIAPGGPIDLAISVGTDGAYWLINQANKDFSFEHLDPRVELAKRRIDDDLPGYYYRDDALKLWDAIGVFAKKVLRLYYTDDAAVAGDDELANWARELSADDAGRIRGLPLTDRRFATFDDLHHVVQQVIFTASCEHSAVNNGQYDYFGYIPNAPGSLYLPPPTTPAPKNEAEFCYMLPPMRSVDVQMTLVHLLSAPPMSRLGDFPTSFFLSCDPVHKAIDQFRDDLDAIAIAIGERNRYLPVPYTYLDPVQIASSINV
jgi:arachidonate 15-lipoxygenase